jgi:hypothetical protein
MRRAICENFAHAAIALSAAASAAMTIAAVIVAAVIVAATAVTVMPLTAYAASGATPAPAQDRTGTSDAAASYGCRLNIGNAGIAAYRAGDRRIDAVSVGAYLTCRVPVRSMLLEVTLWKTGLFYDHRQAQTTARDTNSAHMTSLVTSVRCKDQAVSAFFGVAHAVVRAGGRRGDAWVKSPRTIQHACGT